MEIKTVKTKTTQTVYPKGQTCKCAVCGEYYDEGDTFEFLTKGRTKRICKGCADIVHGLV
jgi:hypothetical protein